MPAEAIFKGVSLAIAIVKPPGAGTILTGATMAMGGAGQPIPGTGWVCVQCCVMAATAPGALVLALAALLTAGRAQPSTVAVGRRIGHGR